MFSIQALAARTDLERGTIVIEYTFLFLVVVLVAMVAASAPAASVLALRSSTNDRFVVAVQPALER